MRVQLENSTWLKQFSDRHPTLTHPPKLSSILQNSMDDNFGEWVESMDVASGRGIYILIITITFTPLVLAFFCSIIPTLFIFKMFCDFFGIYSKRCSKNIQDRSKIEITRI